MYGLIKGSNDVAGNIRVSTVDTSSPPPSVDTGVSVASTVPSWQDHDALLHELWLKNQPPQVIAETLGRSVAAVMTRAARLGLPRRSAPGRKPSLQGRTEKTTTIAVKPAVTTQARPSAEVSGMATRICLMCLTKFSSAGRHNRICTTCKSTAEYGMASAMPDIELPSA
jgi:hypothetical protein